MGFIQAIILGVLVQFIDKFPFCTDDQGRIIPGMLMLVVALVLGFFEGCYIAAKTKKSWGFFVGPIYWAVLAASAWWICSFIPWANTSASASQNWFTGITVAMSWPLSGVISAIFFPKDKGSYTKPSTPA
jgi:hypothetical protein